MKWILNNFPVLCFSIANTFFILKSENDLDTFAITLFTFFMGYAFYTAINEIKPKSITLICMIIVSALVFDTIAVFHTHSIAYILLSAIAFFSGFYSKIFRQE